MSEMNETLRPVPRWLHVWAVLVVATTFLMLAVGQLVTSFRAGMADPIWPTEPWYLASNFKLDLGYLIEHSHRILGFALGLLISGLAIGVLLGERCATTKWISVIGLLVLLGGYGEFHRGLIAQRDVPAADVRLPLPGAATALIGLAVALGATGYSLISRSRGAGIRVLAVVALVAVMIQGLLGGFRVKLNELVGTDLATVHGVFAQVVFGLLVSLAVVTARSVSATTAPRKVRNGAVVLAVLLFVQIVWGAMVRHEPTILTQKLHFLTAFAATGVAVWVMMGVYSNPAAKGRVRIAGHLIGGLLLIQLYLGVEAWMEKFGAYTLPELVPITKENAAIRTLHALVGSGLLATAIGLAVRVRQAAQKRIVEEPRDAEARSESQVLRSVSPSHLVAAKQPGETS
ncbi:MAG: hypothetical protein C0467_07725 [Planctomycetaceae bacterium]|nr:hypothetical protein [Planctomycetaceae bacterium]